MKFYLSILIIWSYTFNYSVAQQPAYFTLGEKELDGIDIYCIQQTKKQELYIATNNGLYKYEHGVFKEIKNAKEQKGSSLFSLTKNLQDELFCTNLSGQIFKLVRDSLVLYHTVSDQYLSDQLQIQFNSQNELIIASNAIIKLQNGIEKLLYNNPSTAISLFNKETDGQIYFSHNSIENHIYFIKKDNTIDSTLISNKTFKNIGGLNWLLLDKHLLGVTFEGCFFSPSNEILIKKIKEIPRERYYKISDNELWCLNKAKGLRIIKFNNNELTETNPYFEDFFISSITEGVNGSIFLGTFGNGICVIPSRETIEYKTPKNTADLLSITSDNKDNSFFTTREAQVIHFKDSYSQIDQKHEMKLHKIFVTEGINYEINNKYPSLFYDKPKENDKITLGTVKDICRINESSVLIASAGGLYKVGNFLNNLPWVSLREKSILYFLPSYSSRSNAVAYDSLKQEIYLGESTRLLNINNKGLSKELVSINGESIIVNDLVFYNNQLWCSTEKKGLIKIENNKIIEEINTTNGLLSNSIIKIEVESNILFILTRKGIQLYDLATKKWAFLGTKEGITGTSIIDFIVNKNYLKLLTKNSHIVYDYTKLSNQYYSYNFSLDTIFVAGKPINRKENEFSYDNNDFSFHMSFHGIEFETEAKLVYKLNGLENKWNEKPIHTNKIEYKFLPPGKYNFTIYVDYRNQKSHYQTYHFTIKKPFWETWWFIGLLFLVFGFILGLIFYIRVKRLKAQNNEKLEKERNAANLLETELKALRSQMNPHFIFNSLNSIQDLILKQDTDSSYDYIVLFAELVRNTLNYSNADFIPAEKELDFLEIYLSLEKLRFKEDFQYEIIWKGKKEIEIPSLIIQPFIENALQHGLLHKQGLKKLTIQFEYLEKLTCTIEDNGVGREKAKEIQQRQGFKHDSFALEAIKKRLTILNKQHENEVGYSIIDLHQNTIATGTKVIVKMPFKKRF